jgi:quinolinate synthase
MSEVFVEPRPSALMLLGRGTDLDSERGVKCPGGLPAPSDPGLVERARAAKAALGDRVFILGHHYQRDEVIQFADVTGDSFKLAREAAARPEAEFIVFCGVHFMAESADILTSDEQQVILPDMAAGCSMADMADIAQVERAWEDLTAAGIAQRTIPITYMNSTAAIKAFCGKNEGAVCTSSNAESALRWAFDRVGGLGSNQNGGDGNGGDGKVLFLPDQHLGRNTAVLDLGLSLDDCVVYDPRKPLGGNTIEELTTARMILWRGYCSVHARFRLENVERVRAEVPGVNVIVHPECVHDVVQAADFVGSTEKIIQVIEAAEPGSAWAVGTELNLVRRLATEHPDKTIVFLEDTVCFCATMTRIDLPHLVWVLESLVAGDVVNRIVVDEETTKWARVALDRMLALPAKNAARD